MNMSTTRDYTGEIFSLSKQKKKFFSQHRIYFVANKQDIEENIFQYTRYKN